MADVQKHLEAAQKYLGRDKLDAAIGEYKAAYEAAPSQIELLRSIADLYMRLGKQADATRYYGELFDKYAEKKEAAKGVNLFQKSLKSSPQPPERWAKQGFLLQKSGKGGEAVEAYRTALEQFRSAGNAAGIFECLEKLAALEPDKPDTQIEFGEQANRQGKADLASKAFLRAGQLVLPDDSARAIELLERAHELAPDRSTALNLAQAYTAADQHAKAADLLLPLYGEGNADPAVLETLGAALLGAKRLAEAEEVLEVFYQAKPDSYDLLVDLVDRYCETGEAAKGVTVFQRLKERFLAARRQKDFVERLERLFHKHETVIPLVEFAGKTFNELNQDTRYGTVLDRLFELYQQQNDFNGAADALERMVDIDPYDFNHKTRIQQLKGKIDDARLRAVSARITGAATVGGQAPAMATTDEKLQDVASLDPKRRHALLEDMIVQVEIFTQYGLTAKAIEQLQKVYKAFPGEEARNERLYRLYEQCQYFPDGFRHPTTVGGLADAAAAAVAQAAQAPPTAAMPADTVSDLAKISEITHALFRQTTSKTILHTGVSELGKYLKVSRCLGMLGKKGASPSTAVEFCAPGVPQSPGTVVMKLLSILSQMELDPENGTVMDVNMTPDLKQVGAQSVLAMPLVDKEKQEQEGMVILSQSDALRHWRPNEVYLVKAITDQLETAISHANLRSMMKRAGVAEEAGGVLGRGSYLDSLTGEVKRAKKSGAPFVVALVELDKGAQLLRSVGEATMQQLMQQAGDALLASIRQNDLAFRYTATSLAVVLSDTTAAKAGPVVEKIRKHFAALKLSGGKDSLTFSAGVSESAVRPDYDPLDIVTDVINRAEFSLEAARQKGNSVVVR